MQDIIFRPIGIIRSPHDKTEGMPIQPAVARGIRGSVEVFSDYMDCLKDIEGFSHIILIYHFHLSTSYQLEVIPFLDDNLNGVFATRAPKRPNQIGMSVVKLVSLADNIVQIENVDIVNGTPLLDIKPYASDFDATENISIGWLSKSKHKLSIEKSDERFDFFI